MGKLYTLDHKFLTERPEIRIGDKVFAIDDRKKTFEKIEETLKTADQDSITTIDKVLKIVLGAQACKEIDNLDLSFAAFKETFELVMNAVTGENPKTPDEGQQADRFQKSEN